MPEPKVRIHGNVDQEKLKAATEKFLKKALQQKGAKKDVSGMSQNPLPSKLS